MSTAFRNVSLPLVFLTWLWALGLNMGASGSPLDTDIRVRAPAGVEGNVIQAIRSEMQLAALQKRGQQYTVNTTLDRSWNDAVLLRLGISDELNQTDIDISLSAGVNIVCTTCYIKGAVTGELSIAHDFNASQAINQVTTDVQGNVENLTSSAEAYVTKYTEGVMGELEHHPSWDDFAFPTFNYSFDMNLSSIPEANLNFVFDGLELYMLIDTTMSQGATFAINLYQSKTFFGVAITEKLQLGVIFAVDLILDVKDTVDMSSGFHIRLEDGLAINIALFGDDVPGIVFNGGQFEFLPVIIQSGDIVFTATLRVGVHAGFELESPDSALKSLNLPAVAGGIEVGIFANIAEFVTNVTAAANDTQCEVAVVQSYQVALGAAAGATIAIGNHTWGPMPQTTVPIWYTELGAACATRSNPTTTLPTSATVTARAAKREALMTTTITTEVTYTGVSCLSTGLVNCPASLQNTSQSTATSTLVTAVQSGTNSDDITIPAAVHDVVTTSVAFGNKAVSVPSTSGSPVSYVPPPPPTISAASIFGNATHGAHMDRQKGAIIGLSVGLGVSILVMLAAVSLLLLKKRKVYRPVPRAEPMLVTPPLDGSVHEPLSVGKKAGVDIEVSEVAREDTWR